MLWSNVDKYNLRFRLELPFSENRRLHMPCILKNMEQTVNIASQTFELLSRAQNVYGYAFAVQSAGTKRLLHIIGNVDKLEEDLQWK